MYGKANKHEKQNSCPPKLNNEGLTCKTLPKAQRTQTCDFIECFNSFNSIAQTSDSQSHNLANICENDEFWSAELLHMKVMSKPNPNVFFLGQEKKIMVQQPLLP